MHVDDNSHKTNNMIKISIIIPVYNCIQYTRQVVTQIEKYTSNAYELILIDNGSSDETIELLKSYRNDGNITVIKNTENMGFAYANNQGGTKGRIRVSLFFE